MGRIDIRDAFLRLPRQLQITFFTSSRAKFSQAATIFKMSGARLAYRRHDDEPYQENYSGGKEQLLAQAVKEIRQREGSAALFFIEDTSIRIDALSLTEDYPGLSAKEWFQEANHGDLLRTADEAGSRRCSVESQIALSLPGLDRPVYFTGTTHGQLISTLPGTQMNLTTPWLDPASFSGWFIPDGATRTLGEMSLEESISHDFRARSLVHLLDRLEELTVALNVGPGSYRKPERGDADTQRGYRQDSLFDDEHWARQQTRQVILVVGPTCSGKTTFGVQVSSDLNCEFVDASSFIRRRRSDQDSQTQIGDFADQVLEREGFDMVAREISRLFGSSDSPLVVTGLRTIEEIQHLRQVWPKLLLVSLHAPQRVRYQRFVERASREELTFAEFQRKDRQQADLGLLPVADELANYVIDNVASLEEFVAMARGIGGVQGGTMRGVTKISTRLSLAESQLYRSLAALRRAGRALTTQEISAALKGSILHNNANKMLKRYSALARRRESPSENVRYEITPHGLAFLSAIEDLVEEAATKPS